MFWPCPYMYLIWMFITYDIGYNIYCFWPSFDFTVHIIYNTLTLTLTVRMTLIYLFFILQKHLFFSITLTHLIKWNIAWLVCRENRSAHVIHSPKSVRCRKTVYIDSMFVFLVICFAYRSVEKNPTNVWSNDYKISDKTSLIKVGFFSLQKVGNRSSPGISVYESTHGYKYHGLLIMTNIFFDH